MGDVIDFEELKQKRDAVTAEAKEVLESEDQAPTNELVSKLCELVEAQDKVSGMLLHDLMVLARKVEMVEVSNFNNAASLQVAVTLLKEKFDITQEDFQAVWDRDVAPQLKKLQDMQQEAEEAEKSNIILPNNGNIIVP